MSSKKTGVWFLISALFILGGICLEFVWAFLLEPAIFPVPMEEYTTGQHLFHWILTCVSWGCTAAIILLLTKKKTGFELFSGENHKSFLGKKQTIQILALTICIAFSLITSYLSWNGSKVLIELGNLGSILFLFQYIYYAFETFMFFMIIVFAQKAFEKWFGHINFPYGGIVVALTWGLGHILSKGSLSTGFYTAVCGFIYGIIYLLANRNAKVSYLLLFVCFIL